jgi:hypothetical protein
MLILTMDPANEEMKLDGIGSCTPCPSRDRDE